MIISALKLNNSAMKKIFALIVLFFVNLGFVVAQCSIPPNYSLTTAVKTPNNSTVPNAYLFTGTDVFYNPAQVAALEANLKMLYGSDIEVVKAPTYQYNSHGYTWHVSSGGSNVVIDFCNVNCPSIYVTDASYLATSESLATHVVYYNCAHSARRITSSKYESKWGRDGALIRHPPNAVPSNYNASLAKSFYVKNPAPPPPIISGSSPICFGSPKSFSATNWQSGYYWDKNTAGLIISNTTSNPTTISLLSSSSFGTGTIYVRNSAGAALASYNVSFGGPSLSSIIGPTNITTNAWSQFTPSPGAHTYEWVVAPNNGVTLINYGSFVSIFFPDNHSSWRVSCRIINSPHCPGPWHDHYVYAY